MLSSGYIKNFIQFVLCLALLFSQGASAQLTVSANQTAAVLSSALAGPGITISAPVLTCSGQANGTFTTAPGTLLGGTTAFPISSGIMLTTGKAVSAAGNESTLASTNNGTAGDPALATLALTATLFDACILEFDMTPVGTSVNFNYVFGSEEYNHSTCGPYNDAFAFFISGPGIAGTQDMALVPGTNIPVTVNSVNSGVPGPGYTLANCTAMGPGSPFPAYFIDNTGGTRFTYKGFTTLLAATHTVTPCATYHLKMTITDAGNSIYDSGVFIEAGSLTTPTMPGATVCVGGTSTMTSPLTGGTWSSNNTAVATIVAGTGVVSGVAAGTSTITYTISTGCYLTSVVTVNSLAPITGTTSVCVGGTTTLTSTAGAGTWTSSNTAVATIGASTGVVNGLSAGTTTISFSTAAGCSAVTIVTVSSVPAITGTASICVGATTTLSDATAGGTWSSSATGIATVGLSSGIVTGVAAGTTNIVYTVTSGCSATIVVTVLPTPTAITGPTNVCVGNTIALNNTIAGGNWSSSNTAVATVVAATGVVSGVSNGTATISYTLGSGCFVTTTVTVSSVAAITGTLIMCTGQSTTLSDATTGGNWTSGATGVATVGAGTGIVTGVSGGTAVITYGTISASGSGCSTTAVVTVTPAPSAIAGPASVCAGSTITLGDAVAGGVWSSSNTAVATVSAAGVVTGVSAGVTTITYLIGTGCQATVPVTVNAMPAAITGSTSICIGYTIILSDVVSGGTWSSSNTAVATINPATGIVTGLASGSAIISYALAGGCYQTDVVTVNTVYTSTFNESICQGQSYTFGGATYTTAGSYAHTFTTATCDSVVTLVLTINLPTTSDTYDSICSGSSYTFGGASYSATGVYTYQMTNIHGCDSTVTLHLFVKPLPPAPVVVSPVEYCIGQTAVALIASGQGLTWYGPGGTSLVPVIPVTTTAGTTTYQVSQTVDGCEGPKSPILVTVHPFPNASISAGRISVCLDDTTFVMAGSAPGYGYVWSVQPGAEIVAGSATEQGPLTIQFNSLGYFTIHLMVSLNGGLCASNDSIRVHVLPSPTVTFYVKPDICQGDTIVVAVSSATAGVSHYVWDFGTATIITANDMVTGGPYKVTWNTTGIQTIKMHGSIDGQCYSPYVIDTVNVHPLPDSRIIPLAPGSICAGDSVLLSAMTSDLYDQYQWAPEHFFNNNNKPEIFGTIEIPGFVSLTVTTPFGCTKTDSLLLNPQPCCSVTLPNAFTPNGENNKVFRPITMGHHKLHEFRIMNRFGQCVFETADEKIGWDGRYNGVPQDMDTYYYYLQYDCDGRTIFEKGDVTLVR